MRHLLITSNSSPQVCYQDTPKCACTFLRKAIIHWQQPGFDFSTNSVHKWRSFATVSDIQFQEAYSFSFVRDPIKRLCSVYQEKIRTSNYNSESFTDGVSNAIARYGFTADMTFLQFVQHILLLPDDNLDPHIRPFSLILTKNNDLSDYFNVECVSEVLMYLDQTVAPGLFFSSQVIDDSSRNLSNKQPGFKGLVSAEQTQEARPLILERYARDYKFLETKITSLTTSNLKRIFTKNS